jgi:hypothetical protein
MSAVDNNQQQTQPTFAQAVEADILERRLELAQQRLMGICPECGMADHEHKMSCGKGRW